MRTLGGQQAQTDWEAAQLTCRGRRSCLVCDLRILRSVCVFCLLCLCSVFCSTSLFCLFFPGSHVS